MMFFAPDLGFVGYAFGARVGAWIYNALHLYGFGLGLALLGLATGAGVPVALGWLWLAHAGFDRMLGYGLKSASGFPETHLGRIGRGR